MNRLLRVLCPHTCIMCSAIVSEQGICGSCWGKMNFLGSHACERCYRQFPYDMGPGALCNKCNSAAYYVDTVRSVIVYDKVSRPLIFGLKGAHNTVIAETLSRMMMLVLTKAYDYITPVPLHLYRFIYRGYNQSEVLAAQLAKILPAIYLPDMLCRSKFTPSQGSLNQKNRAKNVLGAFEFNKNYDVKGKSILLVDDVYTTGSTTEECGKVLKKHGAANVVVVTPAMVLL